MSEAREQHLDELPSMGRLKAVHDVVAQRAGRQD